MDIILDQIIIVGEDVLSMWCCLILACHVSFQLSMEEHDCKGLHISTKGQGGHSWSFLDGNERLFINGYI